jgi:hypothetical protein
MDLLVELHIGGQKITTTSFIHSLIYAQVHDITINETERVLRIPLFDFTQLKYNTANCLDGLDGLDGLYGLPLISLQYYDVALKFKKKISNHNKNIKIYVNGKYLLTEQRRILARISHEYLITQVTQIKCCEPNKTKELFILGFVQFMIFFIKPFDNSNDCVNYPELSSISLSAYRLEPAVWNQDDLIKFDFMDMSFYVLSFDPIYRTKEKFIEYFKNPIKNQNIRGVNFSRIDRIDCTVETDNYNISHSNQNDFITFIIPFNANYLRVRQGMSGMAFTT